MTINNISIHDTARRPWGFETLVTVNCDNDETYNLYVPTKKFPAPTDVTFQASETIERILSSKQEPIEEELSNLYLQREELLHQLSLIEAIIAESIPETKEK